MSAREATWGPRNQTVGVPSQRQRPGNSQNNVALVVSASLRDGELLESSRTVVVVRDDLGNRGRGATLTAAQADLDAVRAAYTDDPMRKG